MTFKNKSYLNYARVAAGVKSGGIVLTKKFLESYRSKKAEIWELQNILLNGFGGDSMIGNDTILDYRKGYPVPQTVVGVDWDKVERTERRYEKRIEILKKECEDVEQFIDEIPDSLTRRIFRMYFIENMTQKEISKIIHIERSAISRRIDKFFSLGQEAVGAYKKKSSLISTQDFRR